MILGNYKKTIEKYFDITNKDGQTVPFIFNSLQNHYYTKTDLGKEIILKFRQPGFSSLITGIFTVDFLLVPNSTSVVVADIDDNAEMLLKKVKGYIKSWEQKRGVKVPLKYNSKSELENAAMNSVFQIGTAKNTQFGRSRTIHNLHLSEVAFFPNIDNLIAGAGQAVVEGGKFILETTANGFNDFRRIYTEAKAGENGFTARFFKASDFYSPEFLAAKQKELKRMFNQEYPETDAEAFLTSGDCFFDIERIKVIYNEAQRLQPMTEGALLYV